jgi:hypothetical protein
MEEIKRTPSPESQKVVSELIKTVNKNLEHDCQQLTKEGLGIYNKNGDKREGEEILEILKTMVRIIKNEEIKKEARFTISTLERWCENPDD